MIIYEVSINVNLEILKEYTEWLKIHIDQMLAFPGFKSCSLLNKDNLFRVLYYIESKNDYENYVNKFASKMRNDGIEKFRNKFTIERNLWNQVL